MTDLFVEKADLSANVEVQLGSALTANMTTNVRFCNRNSFDVTVTIAIGTGASAAAADYIEFGGRCPANDIVEETGLLISIGEKIFVKSNNAGVSVRAHGLPVDQRVTQ